MSREQALDRGLTPNAIQVRLESGRWEPCLPGVYRLAGTPIFWRQTLRAALLWAGDGAVASHRSAAALWELEGYRAQVVEITTARKMDSPAEGIIVHFSSRLRPSDPRPWARKSFKHDRRRRNRLTGLGWRLVHTTWDDQRRPEEIVATLKSFFP